MEYGCVFVSLLFFYTGTFKGLVIIFGSSELCMYIINVRLGLRATFNGYYGLGMCTVV